MRRHVLLIEDEQHIAEAISFLLGRDGWDVTHLADGLTAEDEMRRRRPDLVILDLMLPGRSGFEVLAAMRADPDLSRVRVMMLTAKGQGRERDEAERAGVDLFMSKPFSNAEMLASVRALAGVS